MRPRSRRCEPHGTHTLPQALSRRIQLLSAFVGWRPAITKMCVFLLPVWNHILGHRLFQQSGRVALPPTPQSRPAPSFSPASRRGFLFHRKFRQRQRGTLPRFLHFPDRGSARIVKLMSILDEYRRNARECQRMAENAGNATDRGIVAAVGRVLARHDQERTQTISSRREPRMAAGEEMIGPAWPNPSEEESEDLALNAEPVTGAGRLAARRFEGDAASMTSKSAAHEKPPRARDQSLSAAAQAQSGRLVALGPGGAGRSRSAAASRSCSRSATPPATGAMSWRTKASRTRRPRGDERAVRQHQGRSRGAARTSTRSTWRRCITWASRAAGR